MYILFMLMEYRHQRFILKQYFLNSWHRRDRDVVVDAVARWQPRGGREPSQGPTCAVGRAARGTCRGGDRGGARARLHRDRGRVVQTTEPDDGGQSPRHEAWCAAPVDAVAALSHTPESPHPKRCPPVLPASRCCFAPVLTHLT
jgi:hypothetical protein